MQAAAVLLVTSPTLHKSWWGASHGGTHVKRAPTTGEDGGGGFSDGQTLPFSSVGKFLSAHVYGKEPGSLEPNPTFIVGRFSDANVAKIAKFIDGFSAKHATLRVSGRSLKHTDEQRHKLLSAVVDVLPSLVTSDGVEVLHNPKRDNSALLVYRRPKADGTNALIVVEIAKNGTGTDIVNVIASDDRQLRQHERKSTEWLEGRPTPHPIASDEAHAEGGKFPAVHPSGDLTIPKKLNKSMPSRLVVFSKEASMNQFDLLKSHIDAYTRKDGAVVQAHEDSRVAFHSAEADRHMIASTAALRDGYEKGERLHDRAASAHERAMSAHKRGDQNADTLSEESKKASEVADAVFEHKSKK
jgi:hypothetical protein